MSLRKVDVGKRRATGYICVNGKYKLVTRAIPSVIHNRTLVFKKKYTGRLKRLGVKSHVFNARNRYGKVQIDRLLRRNPTFWGNLPMTRTFGKKQLSEMMNQYGNLYIKPQSGSVGRGIFRLKKLASGLWSVRKAKSTVILPNQKVYLKLRTWMKGRPYLIQKGIELATHNGRPYDLRVSVQKGANGLWRVTGMVGKVARKGSYVTNIARGGKVIRCETLFANSRLPVGITKLRVRNLSLRISAYLASKLRRLSDVGLDIGVDRYGKPYFIEMNGRDQRYAFHRGGLKTVFFETYANPIRYGIFLAKRRTVK